MRVLNRTPYVQGTHFTSSDGTDPQNMFNDTLSEVTSKSGDLTIVLTPGQITGMGFAGLKGNSLTVVGESDSVEVFSHTQSLQDESITDWFDYFFEPFTQIGDVLVSGIPPFSDIEITITIEGASAECGVCAFGMLYSFGDTTQGTKIEILDYSTKETDEFGVTTFEEGPFSKRISAEIFAPNTQINRMQRTLAQSRATPTFYDFVDGTTFDEVLTVFGFYRDFSIVVRYPQHFLCTIDIEGLT